MENKGSYYFQAAVTCPNHTSPWLLTNVMCRGIVREVALLFDTF